MRIGESIMHLPDTCYMLLHVEPIVYCAVSARFGTGGEVSAVPRNCLYRATTTLAS